MKKIALAVVTSALFSTSLAADLANEDSKIVYTIGSQIGETLKTNLQGPVKIDEAILFEAISDVLAEKAPQLSEEEMNAAMQGYAKKAAEFAQKKATEAAEKNQAEAKQLLETNKAKDGVKVTDSGLQYRVITEGEGKKPTANDTVKVHYKGTLADGTTFDSSHDRGEPAEFPLSAVIPGWTEGVQLMSEGSKYEFVIPAELAYGPQGPGQIGPDRALIFEVELLEIKGDNAKQPATTEKVAAPQTENKTEAPKQTETPKEEAPKEEAKTEEKAS